jgi:hypothetical protein
MRLALALGRTVRELEDTLGADEWDDWIDFLRNYDFPDAFHTTAQLGILIGKITGNPHINAANMSPYFTPAPPVHPKATRKASGPFKPGGMTGAFSFLRSHVKPKRKPD